MFISFTTKDRKSSKKSHHPCTSKHSRDNQVAPNTIAQKQKTYLFLSPPHQHLKNTLGSQKSAHQRTHSKSRNCIKQIFTPEQNKSRATATKQNIPTIYFQRVILTKKNNFIITIIFLIQFFKN